MKKVNENQLLLINSMKEYLEYLKNENASVHKHEDEVRNKAYVKKVNRHFRYILEAVKLHNVDVEKFKFEDVDNLLIGYIYKYLTEVKKFSLSTFNAIIYSLKRFSEYIISVYNLNYVIRFSNIVKRYKSPATVSKSEFERILELVSPENSYYRTLRGEKNFYQSWLKDAYWLSLHTGARKSELVNLKWSDIKIGTDNKLQIEFNNGKVGKYTIIIDITDELKSKLDEMGYEKLKNTTNYIIAPDHTSRKTMVRLISESFSRYAKQLGINKAFNCLRRTFVVNHIDKNGKGSINE